MQVDQEFFNLEDVSQGIVRELAQGINTRIFVGDNLMLSIVTLSPNANGAVHSHPEEQWGVLLEGSAVRIQGGKEVAVSEHKRTVGATDDEQLAHQCPQCQYRFYS